jgi:hypothetical protein
MRKSPYVAGCRSPLVPGPVRLLDPGPTLDYLASLEWVTAPENLSPAAYERRALGIASHWPFDQWGRFLPEHTTAVSLLNRLLHHANVVVASGDSYRMRQARAKGGTTAERRLTE